MTSEERSLAFWLADQGYQVYLSNSRGVFGMGHAELKRCACDVQASPLTAVADPRFWDTNIRELAIYDLPAVVDHVLAETGYSKVRICAAARLIPQLAYIGHSQGNASMFVALARGMVPDLGKKISVFIALAPAVFAGPLTTGFPFGALKSMDWKTWRRFFGASACSSTRSGATL